MMLRRGIIFICMHGWAWFMPGLDGGDQNGEFWKLAVMDSIWGPWIGPELWPRHSIVIHQENGPNGSCVSWTILIPWCARDNRETVYRWLGIIEKKEFLFADRELELALFRFKIYSMEDGEIWAKESKNEGTFLSNIATLPIVFLGGPPNTADRLNIFSWKPFFVVENQQCRGCSSASYVLWSYNELQWWIYTFRVVIIFCILLCKI